MTRRDAAEIKQFQDFLRAVGPWGAAERPARLKAWVAADPATRCAYLGLTLQQAHELGYEVEG